LKINYIKGDLFQTKFDIIAHGCNMQGVMGSGVAKTVKEVFPQAFGAYYQEYRQKKLELGLVQFVRFSSGRIIANCITQEYYGKNNSIYVDYDAIRKCMWCLNNQAKEFGLTVAMPKIGAGLGGGDWDKIAEIIEKEFVDVVPNVYVL
jgi:O-acetyl-ADP-ribose deacetylase (regulator of RNase III)